MPFANNSGVKIHYEVEGEGPTILMQHGFAATCWTWRDFGYAQELSKNFKCIRVDARAHGESDKPHDPALYRPEIVASDYTAILDMLDIEKCHYIGYSMGARIGLSCLARYALPRLNSLILGGVGLYRTHQPITPRPQDGFSKMLEEAVEKGMDVWLAYREKMVGKLTEAQKARQLANDPRALLIMQKALSEWPGAEDILPDLKIPVLIFVGDADPAYAGAKEGAAKLPDATFVTVPGMNHDQALMHSELVIPYLKAFLAKANR
jgi:pimeloyl-ACP methyl ester carboxylesterase